MKPVEARGIGKETKRKGLMGTTPTFRSARVMRWISRVGASGPPMSRCTTSSPNESRHFLAERTIDNSFIRKVAPGFWKHKIRNSWGRRFLSYIYHDHHDHSIYTGCLGGICR